MLSDITAAINISIGNGLLASEFIHGVVSSIIAIYYYSRTKRTNYTLVIFFITYLIDIDHWIDYILYFGLNINVSNFVSLDYFSATGRAIVLFHAWEWVAGFWILSYRSAKHRELLRAFGLGMFTHLIVDAATIHSLISYSFLFRLLNGFV